MEVDDGGAAEASATVKGALDESTRTIITSDDEALADGTASLASALRTIAMPDIEAELSCGGTVMRRRDPQSRHVEAPTSQRAPHSSHRSAMDLRG